MTRFDPVELPPRPDWANPHSEAYDPLLADGWPALDPPPGTGADRQQWDQSLNLLIAAANALLAARPAFVSTTALAARMGVSVGAVRRWVRLGKVTAVKMGGHTQSRLFIPAAEVDRLCAGRPAVPDLPDPLDLRGDA